MAVVRCSSSAGAPPGCRTPASSCPPCAAGAARGRPPEDPTRPHPAPGHSAPLTGEKDTMNQPHLPEVLDHRQRALPHRPVRDVPGHPRTASRHQGALLRRLVRLAREPLRRRARGLSDDRLEQRSDEAVGRRPVGGHRHPGRLGRVLPAEHVPQRQAGPRPAAQAGLGSSRCGASTRAAAADPGDSRGPGGEVRRRGGGGDLVGALARPLPLTVSVRTARRARGRTAPTSDLVPARRREQRSSPSATPSRTAASSSASAR